MQDAKCFSPEVASRLSLKTKHDRHLDVPRHSRDCTQHPLRDRFEIYSARRSPLRLIPIFKPSTAGRFLLDRAICDETGIVIQRLAATRNVETASGGRQVFGAVAGSDTDIKMLIRRNLEAVGQTEDTALTAFTDGCAGLRRILADADLAEPPIARLVPYRNETSASEANCQRSVDRRPGADGSEGCDRRGDRAIALAHLEWKSQKCTEKHRPHPHGYASNSRASRVAKSPSRPHESCGPRCRRWTVISAARRHWLINYAERQRAGLRVGTAITEGTANFLVNRRMNKSQQMRWSRRGADLLLQVRCAVYNGTFGSAYGQKFQPANDSSAPLAPPGDVLHPGNCG